MYLGNYNDGISWVDFRYENLPMFCFGCGMVGHNIDHCRNPHLPFEGGTNPRGAWLRSRNYGRRIFERPEKTFSSNPLKSLSGGPFSPIPKGLLAQMEAMKISRQGPKAHGTHTCNNSSQQPSTQHYTPPQKTGQMLQNFNSGTEAITTTQKSVRSHSKNYEEKAWKSRDNGGTYGHL